MRAGLVLGAVWATKKSPALTGQSQMCIRDRGCPCVLHVLRGLFPREQQRGEDGEDAARELGRDDGAEHGRVIACLLYTSRCV